MRKLYKGLSLVAALAVAVPLGMAVANRGLFAADHLDPPARTDPAVDTTPDKAADIADIYSWYTATHLVVVMTFAGPQSTTLPATYDRDVLYTINLSNDSVPTTSEFPIRIRFGKDGTATGVQFSGVPGLLTPLSGPVENNLTRDGVTVRAGLFDDPFFFDLQGFKDTRSTGTLMFDKNRNFFAGQNLTAFVIQIPRAAIENGTNPVRIWGTTARFGGQL